MNSKIKMLLLLCAGLAAYSCADCDDCCEDSDCRFDYYVDEPNYINKSGMPVKVYVRWPQYNVLHYSYGYAQNEDTTAFSPNVELVNLIEIQFLENSTNCLVYSGDVQDSLTDMRSWKAYEKGDTIPGVYSDEYLVRYFYTITPEHRAMAKKEYCQAPYWMD